MKLSEEQKKNIAEAKEIFRKALAGKAAPRNEKLIERWNSEVGVFLKPPKR